MLRAAVVCKPAPYYIIRYIRTQLNEEDEKLVRLSFFITFARKATKRPMEQTRWKENVVLVDADYVDEVAFDLTVNFERMLERRIPPADLAQWLVCVALDGGVNGSGNEVQVVMVHGKGKTGLENFTPSAYDEMDGHAFGENALGEFLLSVVPDEAPGHEAPLFVQAFEALSQAEGVKRLIGVPAMARYGEALQRVLRRVEGKDVTLLVMEPQAGRTFRTEILGYSLMNALGIRGDEIK